MNFPNASYQVEPTPSQPDITTVYRPVVPFRVVGATRGAVFYGLVDTGSDETILPRSLAILIGLVPDFNEPGHHANCEWGRLRSAMGKQCLNLEKEKICAAGQPRSESSISPGKRQFWDMLDFFSILM